MNSLVAMEEVMNRDDLHVKIARQSSLWQGNGNASTLSGRSTPRNSPTNRTPRSIRTPRKEGRSFRVSAMKLSQSSRLVYWLLLISTWTCLAFYFQSGWAHSNKKLDLPGVGDEEVGVEYRTLHHLQRNVLPDDSFVAIKSEVAADIHLSDRNRIVESVLHKRDPSRRTVLRKRHQKLARLSRDRVRSKQQKHMSTKVENIMLGMPEKEIPEKNSSLGWFFGPFGPSEDKILGVDLERSSSLSCDNDGDFARLVRSRKFLLIFHELSMTGAPISMMELATELLSCGATVSAVVLSRKGGLMPELARRKIKVLDDRASLSFKAARKADLVIAGSAVCASWIEQYISHFPARSSQIAWWIMENRKEYFDRAKTVLSKVKLLIFLTELQSKQWGIWCQEENITLTSPSMIVALSVNDELALVAGISCSLNSPSTTPEIMMEKRKLLRDSVRQEMGLNHKDMLVITLSSINPGKGQLLLLQSASLAIENTSLHHSRVLKELQLSDELLLSSHRVEQSLKILVGSVGSKSNKVDYVDAIMRLLWRHPKLSRSVLWTPATTRVAALYSAADVYVINSQGMGETFGRVTVEAMAFGLPVLGTDAGGTKEIVENNKTGLLHPPGRLGNKFLAQNLRFLLENQTAREEMGIRGRKKVELFYLKQQMYSQFAQVLQNCLTL